jgi:hypothetical protein
MRRLRSESGTVDIERTGSDFLNSKTCKAIDNWKTRGEARVVKRSRGVEEWHASVISAPAVTLLVSSIGSAQGEAEAAYLRARFQQPG